MSKENQESLEIFKAFINGIEKTGAGDCKWWTDLRGYLSYGDARVAIKHGSSKNSYALYVMKPTQAIVGALNELMVFLEMPYAFYIKDKSTPQKPAVIGVRNSNSKECYWPVPIGGNFSGEWLGGVTNETGFQLSAKQIAEYNDSAKNNPVHKD